MSSKEFNIDKAINDLKFAKSLEIIIEKNKNCDSITIRNYDTDMLFSAEEYGDVDVRNQYLDVDIELYRSLTSEESTKYYNLIRDIIKSML